MRTALILASLACSPALAQHQAGDVPVNTGWDDLLRSSAAAPAQASHPALTPSGETLNQVLDQVAREAADPAKARGTLLARILTGNHCFPPNMTQEQLAEVMRNWNNLPDSVTRGAWRDGFGPRYELASQTYAGNGNLAPSGQCTAASITYSFVPDNVPWGNSGVGSNAPNDLNGRLKNHFGAANLDSGREYIRQALAPWRKWCGLTYTEVTDDGRPFDQVTGRRIGVGDTRIGGGYTVQPGYIAYNHFPDGGGDMFFDTYKFTAADPFFINPAGDYQQLRATTTHEHGHGLGYLHTNPCNGTKIMEPVASTFVNLAFDDIRGGHRNFGDRFAGNHTSATAKDLGDITGGATGRSLRLRNLSTNGAVSGGNPAGADWFRINSTVSGRLLTVRVKPVGGTYLSGPQMFNGGDGCFGPGNSVVAQNAGDLRLDFYSDPTLAPTFSSFAGGPGTDEIVSLGLGTGTRYIKVSDTGPNAGANQIVQLYDLEIIVNAVPSEPMACAGINRIAYVGEISRFFPINCETTEPGATIAAYQYDLDGDGIFENSGTTGSMTYLTPGVRNATIRVIDSNGKSADDTITVTVLSKDACDGAQEIASNTPIAGSTVGATASGDALHTCVSGSDAGVWYRYIPAATMEHQISTCQATLDTVVSVFSGDCAGGLTPIACNDDDELFCAQSIRASNIPSIMLTGGVPYYIKVSGYLNASGSFTLTVSHAPVGSCCNLSGACTITQQAACSSPSSQWVSSGVCRSAACPPPHDACAGMFTLPLNTPISGSTAIVPVADPDNGTLSCPFGSGRIVWFRFTPTATSRYKISSCGGNFSSQLFLFTTDNCANPAQIACDHSPGNPVCGGADRATLNSVSLAAGSSYRIALGGVNVGTYTNGNYTIVVRCFADFDNSGSLAVQDIFDFLNAWFAGSVAADTDASGTLSVQDIFDFLNLWFAGCA